VEEPRQDISGRKKDQDICSEKKNEEKKKRGLSVARNKELDRCLKKQGIDAKKR